MERITGVTDERPLSARSTRRDQQRQSHQESFHGTKPVIANWLLGFNAAGVHVVGVASGALSSNSFERLFSEIYTKQDVD